MKNSKKDVSRELHRLFGLSTDQVESVIGLALKGTPANSFCDIYFQAGSAESLSWDQGSLKGSRRNVVAGAGVRVVIGDKVGFWPIDKVDITGLKRAAKVARQIADYAQKEILPPVKAAESKHDLYDVVLSPTAVPLADRMSLLKAIDAETRSYDARIENVSVSLSVEDYTIIVANSLNQFLVDQRPLLHCSVTAFAHEGKRVEKGSSGGGGRIPFAALANDQVWKQHAQTAAEQAILLLSAGPAPAGEMTVVLGNGWPGVLLHEAVGHGLEGDFNRKGTSAFASRMGERVASPLVTVIDDGTLADRRGSLNFDDEGTPTTQTVLIENGVLKGYMHDRQNAQLMGMALTGNARRESYRDLPMPRMTNTFMAGGQHDREEIIRSVKYGLYAEAFGGGQVDITNGNYTFSATVAWLIEDGKLVRPVKGATLLGNGPKSLHHVSMVGNDMALDKGIGMCGKNGQDVPVGVGMPTVRIDNVTVGGSKS